MAIVNNHLSCSGVKFDKEISNEHVYTLRAKYCVCSKNCRQEGHAILQVIFCKYNVL